MIEETIADVHVVTCLVWRRRFGHGQKTEFLPFSVCLFVFFALISQPFSGDGKRWNKGFISVGEASAKIPRIVKLFDRKYRTVMEQDFQR